MPTRIRLQRKGKKARPFYHVVIADGRAPRDGKYIERIGTYNPLTTPAEVNIKEDRALYWLQVGAQPSDTVRNLLSREGILLKNHLQIGVNKGAINQAQADAKYNAWKEEKESKLKAIGRDFDTKVRKEKEELIIQERKINEERAKAIAKRLEEEAKAKKAEEAAKLAEAEAEAAAIEGEEQTQAEVNEEEAKVEKVEEPQTEAEQTEEPAKEENAE